MLSRSPTGRVLVDVESSLWRALAVYRVLVFGYAVVVVAGHRRGYARPAAGWLLIAGMATWTLVCLWAYSTRRRRPWPLLLTDLAIACAAVVLTLVVETAEHIRLGAPTLPTLWASACVVAWAVRLGVVGGAVAAAGVSLANLVVRPGATADTFANIFLLFLTGVVVGYVSNLVLAAEAERTRAAGLAAATAERERLARGIHDSVLQVLALVQRRGLEIGGETAELGRLAGEQERILRVLVAGAAAPGGAVEPGDGAARRPDGAAGSAGEVVGPPGGAVGGVGPAEVDLGLLLRAAVARRQFVVLATPAGPVVLGSNEAREVTAAATEALDNVRRHAGDGAGAWVLVEDEAGEVTVTIRDDGVGIPAGRLAAARAEGRLGVAQSIVGRLRAVGGGAVIASVPGRGTEVELRLPAGRPGSGGR